jgi:flagellar biosynthesis protein FlhG
VQYQQTVVNLYPNAVSSQQLLHITEAIESWQHPSVPRGCLEFFVERLIRFNCMEAIPAITNKAS